MNFIKVNSYEELSAMAADLICAQIVSKPNSVLGLATGSSPVGTYKKMVEKFHNGEVDFSSTRTINLDEYAGLDGTHPQRQQTNNFVNISIN